MKIENNYSPLFGAKFINTAKVFNKSSCKDEIVSFVQIEPHNCGDINALENVAKCWKGGDFSTNIYHAACAIRNSSKYYVNNRVYALTKQSADLDKLDGSQILGLVHVAPFSDKSLFIEHLEANPQYISAVPRIINGIGTAILDQLKNLTHKISCFPTDKEEVKNFYYKNGFIELVKHSNIFVWFK